jgi:hypothetical protein
MTGHAGYVVQWLHNPCEMVAQVVQMKFTSVAHF